MLTNSIVAGIEDAPDRLEPFTFIIWLQNIQADPDTDPKILLEQYNTYINQWNKQGLVKDVKFNIIDVYKQIFDDISIVYATEEERRFISRIDINDPLDLDVVINFYAKYLYKLCNYILSKRNEATARTQFNKIKSTKRGLEIFSRVSGLDWLGVDKGVFFTNDNTIINDTLTGAFIEIEELYDIDQTHYDEAVDINYKSLVDFDDAVLDLIKSYPTKLQGLPFLTDPGFTIDDLDNLQPQDFISLIVNDNINDVNLELKKHFLSKYITNDYFYINTADLSSGFIFGKSKIYNDPVNERSVYFINGPKDLKDYKLVGHHNDPKNTGVLLFDSIIKSYNIKQENLLPKKIYVFRDPNTKVDNKPVFIYDLEDKSIFNESTVVNNPLVIVGDNRDVLYNAIEQNSTKVNFSGQNNYIRYHTDNSYINYSKLPNATSKKQTFTGYASKRRSQQYKLNEYCLQMVNSGQVFRFATDIQGLEFYLFKSLVNDDKLGSMVYTESVTGGLNVLHPGSGTVSNSLTNNTNYNFSDYSTSPTIGFLVKDLDGNFHLVSNYYSLQFLKYNVNKFYINRYTLDFDVYRNRLYIKTMQGDVFSIDTTKPSPDVDTGMALLPPVILTHPIGGIITGGDSFNLSFTFSGEDTTVQWFENGVLLPGVNTTSINVSPTSNSSYYAVVVNSAGSAQTNTINIQVQTVPVFTTQPTGGNYIIGDDITITAIASGVPSPTLQWFKNGSLLGGETSNTLSLTSVALSAGGDYYATATNIVGSTTSITATIVIDYPSYLGGFGVNSMPDGDVLSGLYLEEGIDYELPPLTGAQTFVDDGWRTNISLGGPDVVLYYDTGLVDDSTFVEYETVGMPLYHIYRGVIYETQFSAYIGGAYFINDTLYTSGGNIVHNYHYKNPTPQNLLNPLDLTTYKTDVYYIDFDTLTGTSINHDNLINGATSVLSADNSEITIASLSGYNIILDINAESSTILNDSSNTASIGDSIASITSSVGSVSYTQNIQPNMPILQTNPNNNRAGIYFNGSSWLDSVNMNFINNRSNIHIFCVIDLDVTGVGTARQILNISRNIDSNTRFASVISGSTNKLITQIRTQETNISSATHTTPSVPPVNQVVVVGSYVDLLNGYIGGVVNSVVDKLTITETSPQTTFPNTDAQYHNLGYRFNGSTQTNQFKGYLHEMVIIDEYIPPDEISAISRYLLSVWS